MKYLVDTSAWIEYLDGSKIGEEVNKILKGTNEIYVISLIVSELVSKVKRKNGNADTAYDCIIKNSKIFDITPRTSKKIGILHAEVRNKIPSFSLADASILCSAESLGAKILTKDSHFKGFKETILIK
ncbi:MAG TPA: PIN domain-containing protein [Candidatus Nanoarchaeia archaeon]|nr:PIN domain-containing protein [Candidatus Nanoarchaeia archaeon]